MYDEDQLAMTGNSVQLMLSSSGREFAANKLNSTTSSALGNTITNMNNATLNEKSMSITVPRLNAIYLAANTRLTTFPALERLHRFPSLKIALDNEPSLYRYCMELNL